MINILSSLATFFAGAGGALSTPSGVNAALLPTYCPADPRDDQTTPAASAPAAAR